MKEDTYIRPFLANSQEGRVLNQDLRQEDNINLLREKEATYVIPAGSGGGGGGDGDNRRGRGSDGDARKVGSAGGSSAGDSVRKGSRGSVGGSDDDVGGDGGSVGEAGGKGDGRWKIVEKLVKNKER